MKVFILNKKQIITIACIIVLIIMCLVYFILKNKNDIDTTVVNDKPVEISKLIDKVQNITEENEKIAYLTFDDGPNISVTPKVLDILKDEEVKATFFVIGKHVDAYPQIVKRAYEEGHYIANHTYSHNNETLYKSEENFINEVTKTDIAIGKAIGKEDYHSYIFRFPNGYMAPLKKKEKKNAVNLLSKMNYTYIDWNSLNNDSMRKYSKEQLLENLKKSVKDKNVLVILMHDTKDVSDSSIVLQDSIHYLKSQGYVFKNFYDLINGK